MTDEMVRCESNKLKDIKKRTESCKRKYESSRKKMQTKKSGRKNSMKKLFSSKNTTGSVFDSVIKHHIGKNT